MKERMKCPQVKKRLTAFLDNEVRGLERLNISEHLMSCVSCQKELEELSQISGLLDLMAEVAVSPYFMTRLKQRIAEGEAKRIFGLPSFKWLRRVMVPVGITALFAISVLGGNYLGHRLNQRAVKVAEMNEEVANLTGITSFEDFSEGSLVDAYGGLLSEGGK